MNRATRSNNKDKQKTHGKKCKFCDNNYKIEKQKQSKHVKIANQKIKTTITNYIAQSTTESKAQKEIPFKIITRQTTAKLAAAQEINNKSNHAPRPSLKKAAGKVATKLRRTGNKYCKKRIIKNKIKTRNDVEVVAVVQQTNNLNIAALENTPVLQPPTIESSAIQPIPKPTQNFRRQSSRLRASANEVHQSKRHLVIVVDTNVLLKNLEIVDTIITWHYVGYVGKPTIMVPSWVIKQIERIQNESRNSHNKSAIEAMKFLHEMLTGTHWIETQDMDESVDYLFSYEVPDDAVINCCLQQLRHDKDVILLSNDSNLCNRATTRNINNVSSLQIIRYIEKRPRNYAQLYDSRFRSYKANIYNLLSTILKTEMLRKPGLKLIISLDLPWTLVDVLDCIFNHWDEVLKSIFPRIQYQISVLRNYVNRLNNKSTLEARAVGTFQKMCLRITQSCKIIPHYMALAIETENSLKENHYDDLETYEIRQENKLHNIFDKVYVYFESYCAKFCTSLGVRHFFEGITYNESTEELLELFPLVNKQLKEFVRFLKEVLSADTNTILYSLSSLNGTCSGINADFSFLNKSKISPDWYINKSRDLIIKKYKYLYELKHLFTKCSLKIRENVLIASIGTIE